VNTSTVLLSILNLILPGAGLFWRKQTLQGAAYALCFAILNVFRHDIGAVWAIYVLIVAQVHFHKVRRGVPRSLARTGKLCLWLVTGLLVALYSALYGPGWTHNGELKEPHLLFGFVVVALTGPAFVLTFFLERRGVPQT
jgi:hypothetical protein